MTPPARRLLFRWLQLAPGALGAASVGRRLNVAGLAAAAGTGGRRRLLQQLHGNQVGRLGNGIPRRGVAGSALRIVAKMLRLRYLIVAGTAGGSLAAAKKYEELKDSLPDVSWIKAYLPAEETIDSVVQRMQRLGRFAQLPEKGWLKNSLANIKSWVQLPATESEDSSSTPAEAPVVEEAAATIDEAERLQEQLMELQARYRREAESLEAEARELRRQLAELRLGGGAKGGGSRRRPLAGKPLIDLYSEVLDALSERDAKFSAADHLPRVVVIGDQSAGKTSVLEMLARARIFPRGAGEMMTRAPVQVALADGPYHVARFKDNPAREFDLTQESELAALRNAIERRMNSAVQSQGATVSTDTISLSVQGPGLPRMVLVDLPGIISTETSGMAAQTRESIRQLAGQHMRNPNSIILCVADACVDAERSNAFDLVAKHDPSGRRTIFVLTKMDLAERDKVSPQRLSKLLSGRLLPLKALGYFAVVTGGSEDASIEAIQRHEADYFRNSRLFREAGLSLTQVTSTNMAQAVSNRFWALVRESVEAQADALKALRYNLETEWKHAFPGRRQCSRAELFERARSELLDEIIALSSLPAEHWEAKFRSGLSGPLLSSAVDLLLDVGAASSGDYAELRARLDIGLRKWAESELPSQSLATAWNVLYQQLESLRPPQRQPVEPALEPLQAAVRAEARKAHQWDPKAEGALRVLQAAALDEGASVPTRSEWDAAVNLLRQALRQRQDETEAELARACGVSTGSSEWRFPRWGGGQRATPEQERLGRVMKSLRDAVGSGRQHQQVSVGFALPDLSADDLAAAKRSLAAVEQGVEQTSAGDPAAVETELLAAWPLVRRQLGLRSALAACDQCRKMYYHYQQRQPTAEACHAVPYFYRLGRMLDATSSALRQQVVNNETRRLERAVKTALATWAEEPRLLRDTLKGRSVELAEDIQSLRTVEEKLDQFIEALNGKAEVN